MNEVCYCGILLIMKIKIQKSWGKFLDTSFYEQAHR